MDIRELPKARKINMSHLPVMAKRQIENANLPANYLAAKEALKNCAEVDSVKEISDKHSAIAHYAKQIKDDSLRYYAHRVYIRALHRIGELVSELRGTVKRKDIEKKYGLTQTEMTNASNIAHLSEQELSSLIDRTPPASKIDVCSAGWKKSPGGLRAQARYEEARRDEERFKYETSPYDHWRYLADELLHALENSGPPSCSLSNTPGSKYRIQHDDCTYRPCDAMRWAQMLAEDEAAKARPVILKLIEWLDDFERALPVGRKQ